MIGIYNSHQSDSAELLEQLRRDILAPVYASCLPNRHLLQSRAVLCPG